MSYVFYVLLVLAAIGLVARAVLAARRTERPDAKTGGADTTSHDTVPPAHPTEPVPGSATARHDD